MNAQKAISRCREMSMSDLSFFAPTVWCCKFLLIIVGASSKCKDKATQCSCHIIPLNGGSMTLFKDSAGYFEYCEH